MSILLGIVSKYFMEGIIVIGIAMATKFMSKYFSKERIERIKEGVLIAMLYAEEAYGIGQGEEKWELAWQKLVEILQKQGIKMSQEEMELASIVMKAEVPEINSITQNILPEKALQAKVAKAKITRSQETIERLEILRRKHLKNMV